MWSNKWPGCRRIDYRAGIFLLLLIDKVVTKDFESAEISEEKNYNIAMDEAESGFTETNGNVAENVAENVADNEFRSLQYKSPAIFRSYLVRHGIIPDVLAIAPPYLTEVMFSLRCVVKLGDRIDPVKLQNQPRKIVWPWREGSFYTLVLVDADFPSREDRHLSQRILWLVINIPEYHLKRGDQVVMYMGPVVSRNSGLHRNVFLVFEQHNRLKYKEKRITYTKINKGRLNFSIRDFATKYKLKDPISLNFYLTGWPLDQFVPEITPRPRRHGAQHARSAQSRTYKKDGNSSRTVYNSTRQS